MDIISNKIVKIRKPHRCFACGRKFEKGAMMNCQVNTYDGIMAVYSCLTCQELMSKHSEYFKDDYDHSYPADCVRECYEGRDITPKQLLEKLNLSHENNKKN